MSEPSSATMAASSVSVTEASLITQPPVSVRTETHRVPGRHGPDGPPLLVRATFAECLPDVEPKRNLARISTGGKAPTSGNKRRKLSTPADHSDDPTVCSIPRARAYATSHAAVAAAIREEGVEATTDSLKKIRDLLRNSGSYEEVVNVVVTSTEDTVEGCGGLVGDIGRSSAGVRESLEEGKIVVSNLISKLELVLQALDSMLVRQDSVDEILLEINGQLRLNRGHPVRIKLEESETP